MIDRYQCVLLYASVTCIEVTSCSQSLPWAEINTVRSRSDGCLLSPGGIASENKRGLYEYFRTKMR